MSDKARELLSRCLRRFNKSEYECSQLVEEIELYLADPQKKHEPLSDDELDAAYTKEAVDQDVESWWDFKRGIRFAEKHHGIGGEVVAEYTTTEPVGNPDKLVE